MARPQQHQKNDEQRLAAQFQAAVLDGDWGGAFYLIKQGADARADNEFALRQAAGSGECDAVEFLVDLTMADVHVMDDEPLMLAALNNDVRMIKTLLAKGADPAARDRGIIEKAERLGCEKAASYLRQQADDAFARSPEGRLKDMKNKIRHHVGDRPKLD